MKDNVKIFIAAHKQFNVPQMDLYIPLHVGARGIDKFKYELDSSGDNISSKNANYCELTGLYWIWKNVQADIVGLVHYRRYFYKSIFSSVKNILSKEDILSILDDNDVIVANRGYTWFSSVYKQYEKNHIAEDLNLCKKIIEDKYPEYLNSFNMVFNGDHYFPFNMMICKKEIFDEYCSWLFDIFSSLEDVIDLNGRDKYNGRVYGFLSERLLNVWLIYNEYKVAELPVLNIEENIFIQRV